jgi:hypothetical protein
MFSLLERAAAPIPSDATLFKLGTRTCVPRGTAASKPGQWEIPSDLSRYIPFVDIRTIFTGVSSRISTTSLLPDEAAAWASAASDKDDDFRSRSPPNIDWLYIFVPPFVFRVPSHVPPLFSASTH